jgi:5-methylcytosine-specific restriction enzyme A|tara:strand:- start:171 stop:899 length:729 start_codon:yes stop_codon:yes gene_type:complete
MATITNEMIENSYDIGKKFFQKKITLQEGTESLSNLAMNRNSAVDYIYLYSNLIQGKLYTRTSNAYGTEYYLTNIYEENGIQGLENGLLSLLQHIEYYEDKAGVTLNKQRSIYENFLEIVDKEPELTVYPDDIDDSITYSEGKAKKVLVNSYERNPHARKKCIEHYGLNCQVCDFNFEDKFGELGRNFIHVHHIVDISTIGNKYSVDPITDLVPVCPNCHAMLHKKKPAYSVEELKKIKKLF